MDIIHDMTVGDAAKPLQSAKKGFALQKTGHQRTGYCGHCGPELRRASGDHTLSSTGTTDDTDHSTLAHT